MSNDEHIWSVLHWDKIFSNMSTGIQAVALIGCRRIDVKMIDEYHIPSLLLRKLQHVYYAVNSWLDVVGIPYSS